jgi:hypothetical protein
MMDEFVTLHVRPGETLRFPNQCVACGQPARERMSVRRRRGQVVRRFDAPLCAACARQLSRRSGQEERWLRLGWLVVGVAAVAVVLLSVALLPFEALWLRLAIGALVGLISAFLLRLWIMRQATAAELPEKRAVRESARLMAFGPRAMTLAFARSEMAAAVRELNAGAIIAPAPPGEIAPAEGAGVEETKEND